MPEIWHRKVGEAARREAVPPAGFDLATAGAASRPYKREAITFERYNAKTIDLSEISFYNRF